MADNKKIITDELLKLQTEKVLQVIADNVYQEEEYLEQEIDDMFDATPQEISYYESLINPDVVSENRLWSSKTIDEKLASAILEANKYTDQASTRNLTTEIVSSTADVTKENVLYLILSDASTNTYEQYMLIGGTATALGSTQVDLSNIYNKSEIDSKLDDKANKSEVLSMDSVQATTGSETNDTVYTSKLTKDELDKKANDGEVLKKTDISKTINSTSTDDTVPTNKAVYDACVKNNNIKTFTELEQIGLTKGSETLIGIATNLPDNSILTLTITTEYNITEYPYKYGILVVQKLNNYRVGFTFFQDNGIAEWINYYNAGGSDVKGWARLCGTSVADVAQTNITSLHSNVTSGNIYYQVKNGICYVSLIALSIDKVESFTICEGLPRCSSKPHCVLVNGNANTILGLVYVSVSGALGVNMRQSGTGYCEFSYPVAE